MEYGRSAEETQKIEEYCFSFCRNIEISIFPYFGIFKNPYSIFFNIPISYFFQEYEIFDLPSRRKI